MGAMVSPITGRRRERRVPRPRPHRTCRPRSSRPLRRRPRRRGGRGARRPRLRRAVAVVGILLHHEREQAAELARDAAAWLADRGHEVRLPLARRRTRRPARGGRGRGGLRTGLDLAVSLGGDGTMLRTVDLVAADGVPVLGVNVGQLGYLTEVEPTGAAHGAEAVPRRLLRGRGADAAAGRGRHPPASRRRGHAGGGHVAASPGDRPPTSPSTRRCSRRPRWATRCGSGVSIDGEMFTPYAADGLIVATPTGSTAYAFSARGPIVDPTHRCLLMTPVSPHMLFDRSLVLAPDARLRIEVRRRPGGHPVGRRPQPRHPAARRRRHHDRGRGVGPVRDLRSAQLPAHPEDQVRAGRPMTGGPACWSELAVRDLGVIAELRLVLGSGHDGRHRRDRRREDDGGRRHRAAGRRPGRSRAGADRARRRPGSRAASSGAAPPTTPLTPPTRW